MKIFNSVQTKEGDIVTTKNENISSVDLMERAALACFNTLTEKYDLNNEFIIVCGRGNNGGDGLALARMLKIYGYKVKVYMLCFSSTISPDCKINLERFNATQGEIINIFNSGDWNPINKESIIIDAIFGTGISNKIEGEYIKIINKINNSGNYIISVDLPSGLFCDKSSIENYNNIIKADLTLTFAPLKIPFMFAENFEFTGEFEILEIGISKEYINNTDTKNYYITESFCKPLLKVRNKFAYKNQFGHTLLIAGSNNKPGAAVLSAKACHRAGTGLLTLYAPAEVKNIVSMASCETMFLQYGYRDSFMPIFDFSKFDSIGCGPGIGTDQEAGAIVKHIFDYNKGTIIFDADAINIISENRHWFSNIPENSIFTPHHGEFERLTGFAENDYERNEMQRKFSIKYRCYIVLKGAHTSITTPEGKCYFNSTGNPGMATAGSGDVLTGIISGLSAQGYSPLDAAILGVYLHGKAGDLAANDKGLDSLIASDIIDYLPYAFLSLAR